MPEASPWYPVRQAPQVLAVDPALRKMPEHAEHAEVPLLAPKNPLKHAPQVPAVPPLLRESPEHWLSQVAP